MKTIALVISLLFTIPVFAACKCNCDPTDFSLCASSYDLEHPCKGMCDAPAAPARTACPTVKIYNQFKDRYEWLTLCTN